LKNLKPIKNKKGVFCPKCKAEVNVFTTNRRALCKNNKESRKHLMVGTGECDFETTTSEIF